MLAYAIQDEYTVYAEYNQFLKQKLPEDVKLVFERLKSASESHLKAYQNALTGGGRGNGRQK